MQFFQTRKNFQIHTKNKKLFITNSKEWNIDNYKARQFKLFKKGTPFQFARSKFAFIKFLGMNRVTENKRKAWLNVKKKSDYDFYARNNKNENDEVISDDGRITSSYTCFFFIFFFTHHLFI